MWLVTVTRRTTCADWSGEWCRSKMACRICSTGREVEAPSISLLQCGWSMTDMSAQLPHTRQEELARGFPSPLPVLLVGSRNGCPGRKTCQLDDLQIFRPNTQHYCSGQNWESRHERVPEPGGNVITSHSKPSAGWGHCRTVKSIVNHN